MLVLLLTHAMTRTVEAVEQGVYPPPRLDGFLLASDDDADGDGDGVKETHIKRYRDKQGDSIFTMTTRGRLWAWSLDTHGDDDADVTKNYVISDSACTGRFDERRTLAEQFRVPACLEPSKPTPTH